MSDMSAKEPKIDRWPPVPKAEPQVTRDQLKHMTPEAINSARENGYLVDIMEGGA